ncbi:hypothetical protein [Muribaculum intestinale]|uniref:hypothetical protein n=1 Tax=Muribaculum intestinale TaxID=1796646 RepID=UPI00262592BC|nr:hypothetical protein [Muribaculum intestinale]
MEKIILLLVIFAMFGCVEQREGNSDKGVVETIDSTGLSRESRLFDDIEVMSVEAGWYEGQYPQVAIKFRNNSEKELDGYVKVKYQFVEDDEVFDEGFKFLHTASDVNWGSGLIKNRIFKSYKGYNYWGNHKIKAKICFEDNSLIWEGEVGHKIVIE